jgi:hypothetical protein
MSFRAQIVWLLVLALPVASVTWTLTQEEIFRELHDYAQRQAECAESAWRRKFFHLLTCHYCFSHYVTAAFVALTGYRLLTTDWTGYLIAFFALVWVANIYLSFYAWLRQQYKTQKFEAKAVEHKVKAKLEPPRIEIPPAA